MRDDLRRMATIGSGVAELTRHRAEQLARDLLERSKQNRDELMRLVRGEIQNQIRSLGLPSKRDIERLQRRVERLEGQVKEAKEAARDAARTASKTAAPKKTNRSKTSSKKAAAKSTAAKSTASKKTTAKKTTASNKNNATTSSGSSS